MSIPVDPMKLADAVAEHGPITYLVTAPPDAGPRVNQVSVSVDGDRVSMTVGRSAARNLAERPRAVLVWPPTAEDGLTLLADGDGRVLGDGESGTAVEVVVTSAVHHRRTG